MLSPSIVPPSRKERDPATTSSTVKAYDGGIPILDQLGPIPVDVDEDNLFLKEFMTVRSTNSSSNSSWKYESALA